MFPAGIVKEHGDWTQHVPLHFLDGGLRFSFQNSDILNGLTFFEPPNYLWILHPWKLPLMV